MGEESFSDKIRTIISGVAWRVLLLAIRMTPNEYWTAVYEREKMRIDRNNKDTF